MCDFGENRTFAHPILYIYIYMQAFSAHFRKNQQITQRNEPLREKTTEIIVDFRKNK